MDDYASKNYLIAKFNELADRYAGNEHKCQRALAHNRPLSWCRYEQEEWK